MSLMIELDWIV